MNVLELKEKLNIEDYRFIIESLDIPITQEGDSLWRLKSMCHSKTANECDSNLVFYTESKTFTCYSHRCLENSDIFDLITTRMRLLGYEWSFKDSLNYVIKGCNIDSNSLNKTNDNKSWKKIVGKYNHKQKNNKSTMYSDDVLKHFPKLYYNGWINEGIGLSSMEKYEIGYYPVDKAIVIPCRDIHSNLVGIRGRYLFSDKGKYRPVQLQNGTIYKFPTNNYFYGECQNRIAIKERKECLLVEGEKSVLNSDTWFGDNSITLALYGQGMSDEKIKTLLSLGVEVVNIGIDYDYSNVDTVEFNQYVKKVQKIAKSLKPYFSINVLYNEKLKGYKYSPFDFTREEYELLWKSRKNIK